MDVRAQRGGSQGAACASRTHTSTRATLLSHDLLPRHAQVATPVRACACVHPCACMQGMARRRTPACCTPAKQRMATGRGRWASAHRLGQGRGRRPRLLRRGLDGNAQLARIRRFHQGADLLHQHPGDVGAVDVCDDRAGHELRVLLRLASGVDPFDHGAPPRRHLLEQHAHGLAPGPVEHHRPRRARRHRLSLRPWRVGRGRGVRFPRAQCTRSRVSKRLHVVCHYVIDTV